MKDQKLKEQKQLTIGQHCFVHRPDGTFPGIVMDIYKDRVRVAGGIPNLRYDEWFPIKCKLLTVEPA